MRCSHCVRAENGTAGRKFLALAPAQVTSVFGVLIRIVEVNRCQASFARHATDARFPAEGEMALMPMSPRIIDIPLVLVVFRL